MAWLSFTELDKAVVHVIRFTMVVIVESLKNVVHGRREWQTTSVFLLENPMNCSTPGLPVHYHLPAAMKRYPMSKVRETQVRW